MPPVNPTQDQLNARLNPTPVTVSAPASSGLFRAQGDFGSTIYKSNPDGTYSQFDVMSLGRKLLTDGQTPDQYGNYSVLAGYNAGGQAQYGLNYLKNTYGIDYNSLPSYLTADMGAFNGRDPGKLSNYTGDASGFFSNPQTASKSATSTINNTPNTLASGIGQAPSGSLMSAGNIFGGTQSSSSFPTANLQPGATGDSVKQLQDYLVANGYMSANDLNGGYGIYGPKTTAAVAALQQKLGVDNSSGVGYFGPRTISALQGSSGTPTSSTPFGSINPNAPISLGSVDNGVFTSNMLGAGVTTGDILNKTQSYNDIINGYLKQQADATAQLNNVKAQQLQGEYNIMYGLNGAGGSDANLQGAEQQMFDKQMAFKTLPAQIALSNAQTGLELFKQSPQYQTELQSRQTAFNLLQQFPDLGINYNPQLSAEQNLQQIQMAVSNSPRFQAMNSVLGTNPITGQPMIINKLGSSVTGTSIGTPGSFSGGSSQIAYTPGATISSLPAGVRSTGQPVMDNMAVQLFNGKVAPSEVKGRGLQSDAIFAKANDISMALTGKPYDQAAAQSAYDFRNTTTYQNYIGNAPTAIRNLQDMAKDVSILGITGNFSAANWAKIQLISNGAWVGVTQDKINAAKDLLSKYAQSADDIGLLLGTGSGSDMKLTIGSQIFQPNGSAVTTQMLADNVTNTILTKLGDKYRQAGVKDPSQYLSNDMAGIWQAFSGSNAQTSAQTGTGADWATTYNYDADIAAAKQAIANGADKNAVLARLKTKYAQVTL